jgi:hypothetical protein
MRPEQQGENGKRNNDAEELARQRWRFRDGPFTAAPVDGEYFGDCPQAEPAEQDGCGEPERC